MSIVRALVGPSAAEIVDAARAKLNVEEKRGAQGVPTMKTEILPMNDFVFVRKEKKERVSEGGIFLGEKEYDTGRVVAAGPGRVTQRGRRDSMWGLAPGQLIAFSPNGNWRQKVGDEELTVIRRDSVIGIVEGIAA